MSNMKPVQFFGTAFKPNARWECPLCGRSNVTPMLPPIRVVERMWCSKCHRPVSISVDMSKVPTVWGGHLVADNAEQFKE